VSLTSASYGVLLEDSIHENGAIT